MLDRLLQFLSGLFAQDFMPHGHCYFWYPEVLWTHVISDAVIAGAYTAIPLALLIFLRKRSDLGSYRPIFILFALFIFFCGITHLLEIYVAWHPIYRFTSLFKALTATISLVTAVVVWKLIPSALKIPSTHQLNEALQREVEMRKAHETYLESHQRRLESEVKARTLELTTQNEKLLQAIASERHSKKETEQAYRQLREAQGQLLQQEKMASLGQLTAGVAHEINNPLNFITVGVNLMQEYLNQYLRLGEQYEALKAHCQDPALLAECQEVEQTVDWPALPEEASHMIKEIQQGVQRTTQIVESLRVFTQDKKQIQLRIDLRQIMDTVLLLLSPLLSKVQVETSYPERLHMVEGSSAEITQLFVHIVQNAVQAMHGAGKLRIILRENRKDVIAEISDTGPGVPAELAHRIFDPFFTTKDVGQGAGLGLSISYGIVERHSGYIEISNAGSPGACFTVRLPKSIASSK